jgi:tRNA pseudouridine55 synthase
MNEFDNKVFVINKQRGPTSFDIVEAFRKVSRLRRVGHTGTLDPLAEGVLVLCTGVATRTVEHFMNLGKWYEFEIVLGVGTTTLDTEGEIDAEAPCPELSTKELETAAENFLGECILEPPAYSALKKNGKRLYQLARAGETPRVEGKKVTIYQFDITSVDLPFVGCRINCSRGTYVRALARDYGARLGLPAHIRNLVRTAIGPYGVADAFSGTRIFDGDVDGLAGMELADALDFMPGIVINDSAVQALMNGALPGQTDVVRTIGLKESVPAIRILDENENLLAIGSRSEGPGRNRLAWVDSYRLLIDNRRPKT